MCELAVDSNISKIDMIRMFDSCCDNSNYSRPIVVEFDANWVLKLRVQASWGSRDLSF